MRAALRIVRDDVAIGIFENGFASVVLVNLGRRRVLRRCSGWGDGDEEEEEEEGWEGRLGHFEGWLKSK